MKQKKDFKFIAMRMKLSLLLLALSMSIMAQGLTVKGTVKDQTDLPIIGASILIKGTTTGTITDFDGNFTMENLKGNETLVISYMGYISQSIKLNNQKTLNVVLAEDTQTLDEVVVVGYGTMRKSDVTGSIAVTKGKDLLKTQSFSAVDNLRGKASGVNIFNNSGQPGGGSKVIIRGMGSINSSSSPLYVVDGVVMEDFKYLNPNDIERVEVLKDASSAAIYGARGANGVILVTTKRGKKGEEGVQVSYAGSVSAGVKTTSMKTMNSEQWVNAFMTGLANENKYLGKSWSLDRTDYFTDRNLFDAEGNPIYDTNWQDEATRVAISHNHQLNIQQGGKKSSVGAFLNYTDQQGIVNNTYMKRINAKLTYDADPFKWLSTGVNVLVNHTWGRLTPEDGGNQDARRTMIEMLPFMPVKLNGEYTSSTSSSMSGDFGFEGMTNPVAILEKQQRMKYNTQIFGNASLTFHLAKNLDLKTQLGIDSHQKSNRGYSSIILQNISAPNGWAEIEHINTLYWQEETYLTYTTDIDRHHINGMMGLSWQERTYDYDKSRTEGFSDDFYKWNNMEAGVTPNAPSTLNDRWAMNSYFLRGAYSYDNKYMATLTARVDGSSKFGANNKYAFFPSIGLGWTISRENFMKDIEAIDMLKLHTSYGMTGNSEIDSYKSLAKIVSTTAYMGGVRQPASYVGNLENKDLRWEKTKQFDIGFNLNLFRSRLNFDVSYYYKRTQDLLLDTPIPHSSGFETVMKNIGELSNQGVDLMINTVNIDTDDFGWNTTLNMNFNKNKILKLGNNNEDIEPGPWFVSGSQTILRVGESLGAFYGYKRLGIWTEEEADEAKAASSIVGHVKRSKDKQILGKGTPDFTGSFINNFRYKNFDLTLDMQFVFGVDVLQQYMHSTYDRFGLTNGLVDIIDEAYDGTNPNTMQQAIYPVNTGHVGQDTQLDSQWVCDGSYLRANLIQLGYNFTENQCKAIGVNSLRAYASVNNAFVIHSSDFRGFDPEGSSQGDSQWGQNMFFFQYPKPTTFTLGVNISF